MAPSVLFSEVHGKNRDIVLIQEGTSLQRGRPLADLVVSAEDRSCVPRLGVPSEGGLTRRRPLTTTPPKGDRFTDGRDAAADAQSGVVTAKSALFDDQSPSIGADELRADFEQLTDRFSALLPGSIQW